MHSSFAATANSYFLLVTQSHIRAERPTRSLNTISAIGIMDLYVQHVFLHYGRPYGVISDCNPHFTSHLPKELCHLLYIKQNISTVYHPQTNGQLKHTNQWLEQYLHIFIDHCQIT